MKKILTILFSVLSLSAFAQQTTTDNVTLSSATLQPGGSEVKLTVSLAGLQLYTGYQMDITLPEGVEMNYYNGAVDLSMYKNGNLYPYTEDRDGNKTFTHSVSCTYGEVGSKVLRVTCTSTQNESFLEKSGTLFTMYLKATTYAKPGSIKLGLSNCKFATYDAETSTTTGYTVTQTELEGVTIGSSATASLSFSGTTHWSTLILPFDASLPDGVKAYTCTEKDDANKVLKLTPATTIVAYTPYIMYTESDYSGNLTGTVNASNYPESGYVTSGYLKGAIAKQSITTGYVLQNGTEGVKFYSCGDETFTIPAGKCWVDTSGNAAKGYGFTIDETSGIEDVNANVNLNLNANIYNIAGQRVNSDTKGIIIINGKKVLK